MPGLAFDFQFDFLMNDAGDPPRIFITLDGVQYIEIVEEPIYIGGTWDEPSSWKPGPLAEFTKALIVSDYFG